MYVCMYMCVYIYIYIYALAPGPSTATRPAGWRRPWAVSNY